MSKFVHAFLKTASRICLLSLGVSSQQLSVTESDVKIRLLFINSEVIMLICIYWLAVMHILFSILNFYKQFFDNVPSNFRSEAFIRVTRSWEGEVLILLHIFLHWELSEKIQYEEFNHISLTMIVFAPWHFYVVFNTFQINAPKE